MLSHGRYHGDVLAELRRQVLLAEAMLTTMPELLCQVVFYCLLFQQIFNIP